MEGHLLVSFILVIILAIELGGRMDKSHVNGNPFTIKAFHFYISHVSYTAIVSNTFYIENTFI